MFLGLHVMHGTSSNSAETITTLIFTLECHGHDALVCITHDMSILEDGA